MNEFAIIRLPLGNSGSITKKLTFEDLRSIPGSGKVSEILRKMVDGELSFARETKDFRQYKLKCEFYGRKVSIARDVPTYRGEFDIWQHKGGLAMTVGPSMILSRIATAFLSVSLYGEIGSSELFELKSEDFSLLKEYIMKLGGEVTLLHFVGIKNTNYRVVTVTGKKLEETEMWELAGKANEIRRMGFRVPKLGGDRFSFWVGSAGLGSVYQPFELLPHHISGLLSLLEKALLPQVGKRGSKG